MGSAFKDLVFIVIPRLVSWDNNEDDVLEREKGRGFNPSWYLNLDGMVVKHACTKNKIPVFKSRFRWKSFSSNIYLISA